MMFSKGPRLFHTPRIFVKPVSRRELQTPLPAMERGIYYPVFKEQAFYSGNSGSGCELLTAVSTHDRTTLQLWRGSEMFFETPVYNTVAEANAPKFLHLAFSPDGKTLAVSVEYPQPSQMHANTIALLDVYGLMTDKNPVLHTSTDILRRFGTTLWNTKYVRMLRDAWLIHLQRNLGGITPVHDRRVVSLRWQPKDKLLVQHECGVDIFWSFYATTSSLMQQPMLEMDKWSYVRFGVSRPVGRSGPFHCYCTQCAMSRNTTPHRAFYHAVFAGSSRRVGSGVYLTEDGVYSVWGTNEEGTHEDPPFYARIPII